MIEVEEVKKELEQPTETDIRLLFGDLQKPMEALQKVLVSSVDALKADNVDTTRVSVEIERNALIVRLGEYALYHEVSDTLFDLREGKVRTIG